MSQEKNPLDTNVKLQSSTSAAPLEASIKSADTETPAIDKIKDASLSKLKDLETKLLTALNDIKDPDVKDTLVNRAEFERDFISKAGIDGLDPASKTPLRDPDNSKNINDFQTKTKNLFTKNLKQLEDEEADEIKKHLAAVHEMRQALLEQSLRKEEQDRINSAYQKLMASLGHPGQVTAYELGSKPHSDLLTLLRQLTPPILQEGKRWLKEVDGKLVSNDPELLGVASAAGGYKSVEFNGDPWKALRAAKAALGAGLREATIGENTIKKINLIYFNGNYREYKNCLNELKMINDWSAANRNARANKINNVFNEKPALSDKAHIFNELDSPATYYAQKRMFQSLTPEEKGNLASEIKDVVYVRGNKTLTGHQLVNELTQTSPFPSFNQSGTVQQYYASAEAKKFLGTIRTDDVDQLAKHITDQPNTDIRAACYKHIDDLSESKKDPNFMYKVKGKILDTIVDRYHESSFNEDGSPKFFNNSDYKFKHEVKQLFAQTSIDDRKEIINQFTDKTATVDDTKKDQYAKMITIMKGIQNDMDTKALKEEQKEAQQNILDISDQPNPILSH